MSDKKKLAADLEVIESALRDLPVPTTNIDRDQLMYDAGWAAALVKRAPKTKTSQGFSTLAFSFTSGVTVAATLLLSAFAYFGDDRRSPDAATEIASIQTVKPATDQARNRPTNFDSNPPSASTEIKTDLVDWLQNVPPGRNISSGFLAIQTFPKLANLESMNQTEFNRQPPKLQTSTQLIRELLPLAPNQVHDDRVPPAWPAWFGRGS